MLWIYVLAKKQHLGTNTLRFMATQDEPKLIITDKRFEPVSQKQQAVIYCHGTRNA